MAELREVAALIEANEGEHDELVRRRDVLVKAARDARNPWLEIQAAARLSVRGVKLALDRTPD